VRQQTLRSRFPVAVGGHKAKDRTAVSTTTGDGGTAGERAVDGREASDNGGVSDRP
jgi:hypothetical protein